MAIDLTAIHAILPESDETMRDRADRLRLLAQLVKNGSYAVHSRRLAAALLDWDPRRSGQKQASEMTDRRRSYMREYMRRRRAAQVDQTSAADQAD